MAYNHEQAKETAMLPKDTILDGVVIDIKDGKTKDFVQDMTKWKGDADQPAINVTIEVLYGEKRTNFCQVFTYNIDGSTTTYTPNSNMGKFKKKYGYLPHAGAQVKVLTNDQSFCRVKLD